jgi:hypothetical protein
MIRFTDLAVPNAVDAKPIASAPKPLTATLDATTVDRLAVARATMVEIGTPPIEPKPLVDTTNARGGRQQPTGGPAHAAMEAARELKRQSTAVRRAAAKARMAATR